MNKLKFLLNNKNFPNLLLYSKNNIIDNIIDILSQINNTKYIETIINNDNIQYKKTLNYYYFSNINNKNFLNFKNILKKIILSDNYFIKYNKIIIIDKITLLPLNQNSLKNIIQKNIYIKFIIIINNNCFNRYFKSNFLCIHCKFSNINIKNIDNMLYKNDLYEDISRYIYNIFNIKLNKKNIKNIKNISYLLLLNNINLEYIYKIILDILIEYEYSINIIININKFFFNISQYYKNNYLKLIYYEYIFLKCNYIINN